MQEGELLLCFHALREDQLAEIVPELDDRSDDGLGMLALPDLGNERAVDLDPVEREPVQVSERGVADAEVVDREANAVLGERGEVRRLSPRQEQVLGDLELQLRPMSARISGIRSASSRRRTWLGDRLTPTRTGLPASRQARASRQACRRIRSPIG